MGYGLKDTSLKGDSGVLELGVQIGTIRRAGRTAFHNRRLRWPTGRRHGQLRRRLSVLIAGFNPIQNTKNAKHGKRSGNRSFFLQG